MATFPLRQPYPGSPPFPMATVARRSSSAQFRPKKAPRMSDAGSLVCSGHWGRRHLASCPFYGRVGGSAVLRQRALGSLNVFSFPNSECEKPKDQKITGSLGPGTYRIPRPPRLDSVCPPPPRSPFPSTLKLIRVLPPSHRRPNPPPRRT